ncbi:MAG: hypothetical protein H7Y09_10660 [Chitinophagaceae bacterium]|nr:hypothetical protein [Anaerolineae bacterium]
MSKSKSKIRALPSKPKKQYRQSLFSPVLSLAERVLALPRLMRILIAAVFALAVTLDILVVFYVIDKSLINSGPIEYVPVTIATVFGLVMYVAGWQIIVGTIGMPRTAGRVVLWYLVAGTLAVLVALMWFFQTRTIINTPI